MDDSEQMQEPLRRELVVLRQRLTELEAAAAARPSLEEALRERHRQYQHLVEHSLGLLCIHDLEGVLLLVNPAAARALGYPPEAGVGRNLGEFLAPAVQHLFDEYLARIRRQPMDSGLMRVVTHTGEERVWLYRNMRYEEPGKAPYVIGHAQDITERVQAEQELKQAYATLETRVQERTAALQANTEHLRQEIAERQRVEETLRHQRDWLDVTLSSIGDAVIATDTYGTITFMNPVAEALTGWRAQEALGYPIDVVLRLLHERTRQRVAPPVAQVLQEKRGVALAQETVLLTRDGREIPITESGAPIRSSDGTLHGAVVVFHNIAEHRRLEEQLRQAQKMEAIGTLAGGIAHDFNNILAAIIGYTELAMRDLPSSSQAWYKLQAVLRAGTRAKALVQQILTFSRHTEGTHIPVRFPQLLQEILTLLRASLPSTIEIRQHIDTESGVILADATQIHQVLLNLCANAEYAMRETGGILEVRLEAVEVDAALATMYPALHPGPYVRLTVQDTGHGIPSGVVERIYEPFFTTKEVGEGTGIGLSVVHGIVANHRGMITVESRRGQGTTFTIYLPRIEQDIESDAPEEASLSQGRGRILFVDDEEALVRLGSTALAQLGYDVVAHTSSVEALAAFQAAPHHFDLVITDYTMPQMTGEALARALRRLRPDLPIILGTGFSHIMDAEKAKALGIDAFLMKPWMVRDLAYTIQQVFARRRGLVS